MRLCRHWGSTPSPAAVAASASLDIQHKSSATRRDQHHEDRRKASQLVNEHHKIGEVYILQAKPVSAWDRSVPSSPSSTRASTSGRMSEGPRTSGASRTKHQQNMSVAVDGRLPLSSSGLRYQSGGLRSKGIGTVSTACLTRSHDLWKARTSDDSSHAVDLCTIVLTCCTAHGGPRRRRGCWRNPPGGSGHPSPRRCCPPIADLEGQTRGTLHVSMGTCAQRDEKRRMWLKGSLQHRWTPPQDGWRYAC